MRVRSRISVGFSVAAIGLAAAALVVPHAGTGGVAAAAVEATQATAAPTVPYALYPSTGSELYVYNAANSNCSDNGAGSQSQPFCTIAAAASAVQPGQTVVVEPGTYSGATISVQGTSDAPITFNAIRGATVNGSSSAPAFTISGAHDVALDGFSAFSDGPQQAFYVTAGSSGITINGGYAGGNSTVPSVEVDGTSSDVTVSRMAIENRSPVQVDAGAAGVVITGNSILPDLAGTWGILVTGAPGTEITGNTVHAICSGGISVTGASAGVTVANNIVQAVTGGGTNPCAVGTAISVSADSETDSVVDYNLIDPSAGGPLYDWGGTNYTSLADFQAASGQGAHDIAANPDLGTEQSGGYLFPSQNVFWFPLDGDSPAIDSAKANAPGELSTDQFGNPRTDDPSVANTGTGVGYYDRGAVELEGGLVSAGGASAASDGALTASFTLGLKPAWTTNGPLTIEQLDFGDGTPLEMTRATTVQHTYTAAGQYTVGYADTPGGSHGLESSSVQVVVGADYTPVTPVRILDTRTGTGTGKAAPVAAGGTLTLPIGSISGVPGADITAVVMNVTVTEPARPGDLTVYPGSGTVPTVSNLNFSAGETVPNLVTVQLSDGEVSFHNASKGTVQVVADLEGFYGPGGYGFKPVTPKRVLDTRNGTGGAGPLAAGGRLRLNLSGKVPAGTAAVVMNVTVTQPKRSGYLTVYPDGAARPNASNLNFTAGQTVPNLVIVPLANGVADFSNSSDGTVQIVADLAGYFASSGPDDFVPFGPIREEDTRTDHSSPMAAHATYTMNILDNCQTGLCAQQAVAMVDNVTVTQPATGGVLIVYPAGQPRPGVSNLNFSAGETVPNLATVQGGNGQVSFYNDSPGQLQLIVDEYGYYMAAS